MIFILLVVKSSQRDAELDASWSKIWEMAKPFKKIDVWVRKTSNSYAMLFKQVYWDHDAACAAIMSLQLMCVICKSSEKILNWIVMLRLNLFLC